MTEDFDDTMTYTITRRMGTIDWSMVNALQLTPVMIAGDAHIGAEGRLLYDDENLYVHMRATEENIRAEYTEPLSPVFQDSCMEFFFMPDGHENYFNFEINPNGCMLIQFGGADRIDIVKRDGERYFGISTGMTDDGWELSYRIPLEFIKYFFNDFSFDRKLRANMYKCGDKTPTKHYLAWSMIDQNRPNFHAPECFGTMIFC